MSLQEHITSYWNRRGGASYDAQPDHALPDGYAHHVWLDVLRNLLSPASADVLDLGTGTGFLALLLAELGHRVTGTDLADGMLQVAREKRVALAGRQVFSTPPHFALGDAIAPDFPPGSFDAVTSRYLLWTLPDPDAAFRNWLTVLRPGGRLIAIDGLWWKTGLFRLDPNEPTGGARLWLEHYTDEALDALPLAKLEDDGPLVELARAAGFVDVRIERSPELSAIQRDALAPEHRDAFPPLAILVGLKPVVKG